MVIPIRARDLVTLRDLVALLAPELGLDLGFQSRTGKARRDISPILNSDSMSDYSHQA